MVPKHHDGKTASSKRRRIVWGCFMKAQKSN
uniref:Uncharacterized protein n=1 Tax=Anguilla anguilla TaxID=7936 RepID=A0A0E9TAX4_ANGAN